MDRQLQQSAARDQTVGASDVSATLAEQRQRQVRFHSGQGALFVGLAVVGFGFSSMGLVAARTLATEGMGLSTAKLGLLWFGFLYFGLILVSWLTWPYVPKKPRIVPYFARQIGEYGGKTSAAFVRGRGLYLEIVALDRLAGVLGVTPLSVFGFADDYYEQEVRWHAASEGLRTAEALRRGLDETLLEAPHVAEDLEALSSVLRVAADQAVDFGLTLRLSKKDSLQVVSSMECRQGRFW
jgi:hypothetical protein